MLLGDQDGYNVPPVLFLFRLYIIFKFPLSMALQAALA